MSIFQDQGFFPGIDPEVIAAQIRAELVEVLGHPLDKSRLVRLQELADAASKHTLDDLEISIRLNIVWDSLDSGDTGLALATIAWVLDQVAHEKATLDEDQRLSIATQMLQVPILAVRHPNVNADTVKNLLFWMDYFTQNVDMDLHSRLTARHQVELGLGNRLAAGEALDIVSQLEEVPRTVAEEIDCPLHHFRSRIAWAVNTSDYRQALSLYRDGLEQSAEASWRCLRPDDINPLLMMPLAWAGEGDAAWRAHERSYRHQSESTQYLGDIASQLRYCTATWSLAEGLEILGSHAHWFSNPEDPWDLLVATRAGAAFLQRGIQAHIGTNTSLPVLGFSIPGNNPWFSFETILSRDTIDIAQSRLEQVAKGISLAFDARNVNNTISTRTSALLSEPPLCSFTAVKPLLEARFALNEVQIEHGLSYERASWLLPPMDDSSWGHQPVPEFHLLDFTSGTAALQRFQQAVDSLDFESLPPEISARKERLDFETVHAALLGMAGHWDELIDLALPLMEIGERIDDHRQSLTIASYLVQAYWQLDNLSEARHWLIRADDLIDATVAAGQHKLLDDLAFLAG